MKYHQVVEARVGSTEIHSLLLQVHHCPNNTFAIHLKEKNPTAKFEPPHFSTSYVLKHSLVVKLFYITNICMCIVYVAVKT